MKNKILNWQTFILAFIFICANCSCGELAEGKTPVSYQSNCENIVEFGDINICLPKIKGMNECYNIPKVKNLADRFEVEVNEVIGFYLNDATYSKIDSIEKIKFDDYFKIYGTKQLKGVRIGKSYMDEMFQVVKKNFSSVSWNETKKYIDDKFENISIGKPMKIDEYSFADEKAKSIVLLTKYAIEDYKYILVVNINALLIKNRLVWTAYYKNYTGEKSILESKEKNKFIINQMLEVN